jgi:ACS family hexuronate transporter-like MFS transporter
MAGAARGRSAPVATSSSLVVTAAAAILLSNNALRLGISPFLEDFRILFQVDYAGAGALLTAFFATYALTQLPAGLAADRWDPRRVAMVGLVALALAALVLALTTSYLVALAARAAMGVAGGLLFPTAMKLAVTASRGHGAATGGVEAGQALGTLLGFSLLPLLASVTAVTAALVVLALLPLVALVAVRAAVPPAPPVRRGDPRAALSRLLRDRRFLSLALLSVVVLLVAYASQGWFPTYLRTVLHYSRGDTGWLMAVFTLVWSLATPLAGRFADRHACHSRLLALGALFCAASFVALLPGERALALPALALAGAGTGMCIALLWALIAALVPRGETGAAIGLGNAIGQLASASSGVLYGALLDRTGTFAAIWAVAATLALVSAGWALALSRRPSLVG